MTSCEEARIRRRLELLSEWKMDFDEIFAKCSGIKLEDDQGQKNLIVDGLLVVEVLAIKLKSWALVSLCSVGVFAAFSFV